jgi:hypothetical protein
MGSTTQELQFNCRRRRQIFLFSKMPRLTPEFPQLLLNRCQGLFCRCKEARVLTDHSPAAGVDIKNKRSCNSTPPVRHHGAHRDIAEFRFWQCKVENVRHNLCWYTAIKSCQISNQLIWTSAWEDFVKICHCGSFKTYILHHVTAKLPKIPLPEPRINLESQIS